MEHQKIRKDPRDKLNLTFIMVILWSIIYVCIINIWNNIADENWWKEEYVMINSSTRKIIMEKRFKTIALTMFERIWKNGLKIYHHSTILLYQVPYWWWPKKELQFETVLWLWKICHWLVLVPVIKSHSTCSEW